jgi:hypothetical protein
VFKEICGVSTCKLKDTHTMREDNVTAIKKPDTFVDYPISGILRKGAKR